VATIYAILKCAGCIFSNYKETIGINRLLWGVRIGNDFENFVATSPMVIFFKVVRRLQQ